MYPTRKPERILQNKTYQVIMQWLNEIKVFLNRNKKNTIRFFLIFYAVGIAGMLIQVTFPLFVKLIPLALLLNFAALPFFHEGKLSFSHLIVFSILFVIGFLIEAVGVNTGLIFGSYHYGNSLGVKLYETPLIIGLNWLLLVYLTASVLEKTELNSTVKIVAGALLMLGYDLIIEQVAPALDMWYWHAGGVPLQNYLAWFIIAVLFHTLIRVFHLNWTNKLAPAIFSIQVIFFLILYIFLI